MKKTAIFAGILAAFVVGFECGGNFVQNRALRRLDESSPIMTKTIVTAFEKYSAGEITEEEFEQELTESLEFIKIVVD